MKKIFSLILTILLIVTVFASCKDNSANENTVIETDYELTNPENPVATIEMKDGGIMKIELFYDKAPNTVKNFISLANKGYYDGLIFHRVIEGFMIQGGDPNGDGSGGPGYNIVGEFANNGIDTGLLHKRGYVSMARRGNPYNPASCYNTAGSQFFIMVEDYESLDGDYAVFGYCYYGMDVVDKIVSQPTDSNDKPLNDMTIKQIRVDIGTKTYEEPETIL